MKINELSIGEHFIFNEKRWTRLKEVPYHDDTWDCMDEEGRHTPFKGTVEVIECQMRLNEWIDFINEQEEV